MFKRKGEGVLWGKTLFLLVFGAVIFVNIFLVRNVSAITYYAEAFVSNRESVDASACSTCYKTTGVTTSGTVTTKKTVDLKSGEINWMTFTHNAYASEKSNTSKTWQINRSVSGAVEASSFSSQSGYYDVTSISNTANSNGSLGQNSGSITFPEESSTTSYFINSPRNYSDGNKYYLNRDVYQVVFKKVGTYKFCESFKLGGNSMTTVCSEIEVIDSETYYAESFISNRKSETATNSNYRSTGIVQSGSVTTETTINLADKEEIWMTFTHNTWASKMINSERSWTIKRKVSGDVGKNSFNSVSNYYTVTPEKNTVINGTPVSNGALEQSSGLTKFTESGNNYFINTPRNYSDGRNVNYYLNRDVYRVTFQKVGTYTFCEYISVSGKNLTSVCSKVNVVDTDIRYGGDMLLSGDVNYDTDWWSNGNGEVTKECVVSNSKSCNVTFSNKMKKIVGTAGACTSYSVIENVNGESANNLVNNGSFCETGETTVNTKNYELKEPGDKVCQTLRVKVTPYENNEEYAQRTVCVLARKDSITVTTKTEEFEAKLEGTCGSNSLTYVSGGINNVLYCKPGSANIKGYIRSKNGFNFPISYGVGSSDVLPSMIFNSATTNYGTSIMDYNKTGLVAGSKYNSDYLRYHNKVVQTVTTDTETASSTITYTESGLTNMMMPIRVPYNYSNTTNIETEAGGILFRGESDNKIKINYVVNPKTNSETTDGTYNERYATIVKNPKVKAEICYGDNCYETNEESITIPNNSKGSYVTNKTRTGTKELEINIDDNIELGTDVCVRAMIYPENSGSDDNFNKNGNDRWAYSERKCFKVAKRPSIQVWGGSFYTAGDINTSLAVKTLNINGENVKRTFGSFVEQGILRGGGSLVGFGSGASIGYGEENGCEDRSFSCLSPLTIPNDDGGENVSGSYNNKSKERILKGFVENEECVSDSGCITELNYDVGMGETKFIYLGENDAILSDDIVLIDGNYSKLSDMPKLVIYANNINIACSVNRIDALLIAEGVVNTCYDGGEGYDNQNRSNQLKINGSVIAGRMIAGRTYGAGRGEYSIIPAEIIDYDASLYLWDTFESRTDVRRIDVVNIKELAPRF